MTLRLLALFALSFPACAQLLPWVELSGDWLFHAGDDPQFSQPGLDDSEWRTVRLPGPLPAEFGEFCWLRRTVDLPSGLERTRLALTLGKLTENYDLFINGRRIWSSGFTRAQTQIARPRTFDLPALEGSRMSIAIRGLRPGPGFGGSTAWLRQPDAGPYVLTAMANAPRITERAFVEHLRMQRTLDLAVGALLLTLALILMIMFAGQTSRQELLWLALVCATIGFQRLMLVMVISVEGTPWNHWYPTSNPAVVLLLEFCMAALDYRPRWLRLLAWGAWLVSDANQLWNVPNALSFAGRLALPAIFACFLVASLFRSRSRSLERLIIAGGAAIILAAHVRTNVLSGSLLNPASSFSFLIRLGPYEISAFPVLVAFFALVMVAVLIRRLLLDREQKQRLAGELEAARAVQQLLLSAQLTNDDDYAIDAIYEPDQEVGGDFYQLMKCSDGSRVVIVADVSGKGLKAAMLVSFAVGSLQNQNSSSPARLLAAMNTALNGHTGGKFITCCCVRVEPGGEVTIASAGHPPPYVDGCELAVRSGLPLGLEAGAEWIETSAILQHGAQLTILSDGVLEAQNSKGELFGFDRTREVSRRSAGEIAAAARAWGQNDDITVVTVNRKATA